MALYMNGTQIGATLGALQYNNINVTEAYCNGVKVWNVAVPGSRLFPSSGNFVVPAGVYSVQVTVVGAGGSGANGQSNGGGGYAGNVVTKSVSVSPGQVIRVTVGAGGIAREWIASGWAYVKGAAGGNSSFGSIVAAGGSGGSVNGNNYPGVGAATQYGSVDGGKYIYIYTTGFGGQGCIGNGGKAGGAIPAHSARAGGVGAGGGGACFATYGTWSGAGGRGQVLVAW